MTLAGFMLEGLFAETKKRAEPAVFADMPLPGARAEPSSTRA
jgi:hypothetical protein